MSAADGSQSDARVRIGDTERMAAIDELSLHFTEGRLDALEMDERSGVVAAARTRGDLREVFGDLPEDEDGLRDPALAVALGTATTKSGALANRKPDEVAAAKERARAERVMMVKRTIMALTPPLAFLLFFLLITSGFTMAWLVFFAIPAVGALLFGNEFYEDDEELAIRRERIRRQSELEDDGDEKRGVEQRGTEQRGGEDSDDEDEGERRSA